MEYIIVIVGVLLSLFLIGYIMKRKYFKEVDRYEKRKIELMNRPVMDEMSKVKKLNMTGQTEELFERWRKEWDDIVTAELPDIEELLFDAEEYIEKFRFRKAKETIRDIDQTLEDIEAKITKILNELNDLVGSEEKNRNEIEVLKEDYRNCRKNLLAHRHLFGKAENGLEEQLNEISQQFQVFDEKTESGNYLEAREIVLQIKNSLESMVFKMELIPQLIHDCQIGLPSQINEVREGYREMVESGYTLDHLGIEKETVELEQRLSELSLKLDHNEIEIVQQGIEEMNQKLEQLLDLLEKEVVAKQFILENQAELQETILHAVDESVKIQEEIEKVKQSYHVADRELEDHFDAETLLRQHERRYELLAARISEGEAAYSLLSEELAELKQDLAECQREQAEFKEKLNALRKDEMEARKKVRELSRKTTDMIKLVSQSNLPGLSQEYKYLLEDAKESIQEVADKLEEHPLNIPTVREYLEIADLTVAKLADTTKETIDNVKLAERVIQYGNRYRSSYPAVAKGLAEAEESFRNFEYKQAIEQAATVIEEVEPGAMEKINDLFVETNV